MNYSRLIDLSVPLTGSAAEPEPPRIKFIGHKKSARLLGLGNAVTGCERLGEKLAALLRGLGKGKYIKNSDFPENNALCWEEIKVHTHCGTHMDAPWHFGPLCENKKAKKIGQIPLEWCFSDGVVLDFTEKPPGSVITASDLERALKKIAYRLKPLDIVLLHTGADKRYSQKDYLDAHPGMGREGTLWLLDQGVKVVGIDAFGFDRPWSAMIADYKKTRDKHQLWPAHLVGREREYCHMERLANLDKIPKSHSFKVACFPIKIPGASAGWVRPIAII